MEVILSYLENMFMNLPKTPQVLRAKEELASMMEDKYNELLRSGKKENEAVGIVISEFGDLGELAQELGIGIFLKKSGEPTEDMNGRNDQMHTGSDYGKAGMAAGRSDSEQKQRFVSRQEAQEYIQTAAKSNKGIAAGVALCIYCPILIILLGGIDGTYIHITDAQFTIFGLIPLFLILTIAVAIVIYNGMKMERFEYMKKEFIQIDGGLDRELAARAEEIRPRVTMTVIIGVGLCILSVIPLLLSGSMTDNDFIHCAATALLLIVIGIAVFLFIVGESEMECIKVLRQEGDFSSAGKKGNKIAGIVGGIYWPLITAIYLGWSFVTMNWGFTWIIWPVAGVMFGVITSICKVINESV